MDSWIERDLRLEQVMPIIQESLAAGNKVKFSPRGTSMLPMLRQGKDSVELARIDSRLKKYDLPLYQRKNGQYVIHRIIRAGDTYTCMGDNQFVPEPGLEHGQMLARVVAFYRGDKRYETDSLYHRTYCRLWYWSRPVRRLWRCTKHVIRRILGRQLTPAVSVG